MEKGDSGLEGNQGHEPEGNMNEDPERPWRPGLAREPHGPGEGSRRHMKPDREQGDDEEPAAPLENRYSHFATVPRNTFGPWGIGVITRGIAPASVTLITW